MYLVGGVDHLSGSAGVGPLDQPADAPAIPRTALDLPKQEPGLFEQQNLMDVDASGRVGYGMPQTVFDDRPPPPHQYIPDGAHDRSPTVPELEDPEAQAGRVGYGMPGEIV